MALEVTYWMREMVEKKTPEITPEVITFTDVESNAGFVGAVMLLWGLKIKLVEVNWPMYSIVTFPAKNGSKAGTQCKGMLPAWVKAFYEAIDAALVQKFLLNADERKRMLPSIISSDVAKNYTSLVKIRARKNPKEGESETCVPSLELPVQMRGGQFDVPVFRGKEPIQYPAQIGDFSYKPGQEKRKPIKCTQLVWSAYKFYKVNVPKWGISQKLEKLSVREEESSASYVPDVDEIRAMQGNAAAAYSAPAGYTPSGYTSYAPPAPPAPAPVGPDPNPPVAVAPALGLPAPIGEPDVVEPPAKRQCVAPDQV